jgi:hypothetical protein
VSIAFHKFSMSELLIVFPYVNWMSLGSRFRLSVLKSGTVYSGTRHQLLRGTCCPRLPDRSNILYVKLEIWVSSKYWSHSTRTHGITSQEIVIFLRQSYFSHSHFMVSNRHLNLHQTLLLHSVRVLLRSPEHCQATFNGPLGLHAWPGKLHRRLTSPLSQTRCFECNPTPPSFIVRPRGALPCTLLTT